jgi:hypothetical protein
MVTGSTILALLAAWSAAATGSSFAVSVLYVAAPWGFCLALAAAVGATTSDSAGWRVIFHLTCSLSILLGVSAVLLSLTLDRSRWFSEPPHLLQAVVLLFEALLGLVVFLVALSAAIEQAFGE